MKALATTLRQRDSAWNRLKEIESIILRVENRCMSVDGPVTNTRDEMTDIELRRIYNLAKDPS